MSRVSLRRNRQTSSMYSWAIFFVLFAACLLTVRGQEYWHRLRSNLLQTSLTDSLESTGDFDPELFFRLLRGKEYQAVGMIAFFQEDHISATQYFANALEQGEPLSRYFLGLSHYRLGDTNEALKQWRPLVSQHVAMTLVHQAVQANRAIEPLRAKEKAEAALSLDPSLGEAYLELGRALSELGELDAALDSYDKAASLVSDKYKLSTIYRLSGALYSQLGDSESAIHMYQRAIEMTPDVYFGYLQLASAYSSVGRIDEAASQLESAIDLQPKTALAYVQMGDLHRESNRLVEAIDWYQQAKFVEPTSGRPDFAIGTLLIEKGQTEQAIPYLEHSVELGWKPYWVLQELANAYVQIGQLGKATEVYLQVTEAENIPEEALLMAWLKLATIYAEIDAPEQAEEAWQQVLSIDPEHPAVSQAIRDRQQTP